MDNVLKIKPKVDGFDSTLDSIYELFDLGKLVDLIDEWFFIWTIFLREYLYLQKR